MVILKQKILTEGEVLPGDVLKVDSFLNHQVDVNLIGEFAKEWYNSFKDEGITKILTIETAGIALATVTAQLFGVPVVYAKKQEAISPRETFTPLRYSLIHTVRFTT